jgi:glutamate N-acetyltransferase/amino-acid N-acetyltransferase
VSRSGTEEAREPPVDVEMRRDLSLEPLGFLSVAKNVGIRDDTLDFGVVFSTVPAAAAATFTRNTFCGHPVTVGRAHVADGRLQAVVVNSKNANVATGPQGLEDCRETCRLVAAELGISPEDVFPCSTGVIGRPLPMDRIRAGIVGLRRQLAAGRLEAFARAILTTDTRPKMRCLRVGRAVLAGCCKGAGMIEPNMATMLAFFFTDAALTAEELRRSLRAAVDVSFNMLSVDSDTSTSDTAVILANGQAGPVDAATFAKALTAMAVELAQEVARDGEGATKLVEVRVTGAPDTAAARRVAKSVVNSPLVKTAVWGGDPNWGRVAMAVGKCFELPLQPERVRIAFGDVEVYAGRDLGEQAVQRLRDYLRGERVVIRVDLGLGEGQATAWGCDLTPEYVRINGEYTT